MKLANKLKFSHSKKVISLKDHNLFQLVNVMMMVPEMFPVITTLENVLAKLMSLVINATSVLQDSTHSLLAKVHK